MNEMSLSPDAAFRTPGRTVLQATGLTKRFHEGRDLDLTVLRGIDLDIRAGETVAIVGASGSGKSTLLHMLGGLDAPTSGSVQLMGQAFSALSLAEQGALRNRHLGFVYQFHHLLAEFTAAENVAMPLWIRRADREEAHREALRMLEQVGLADRAAHRPGELSGGERQRVAIARALINNPSIIMADEPTGNLDTKSGDEIMNIFRELHEQGRTIILVTHEPDIAENARRIIHVRDGLIVSDEPKGR